MRRFFDSLGEVLRAMWTHKLRSFLTMFGIAWGVGSLLLLVGLGEGFRAGTARNLASFGEDFMQIYNGRVPALGSSQLSSRQYYLNYQDYLDIRHSQFVRNATPIIYRGDLRLVSEYGSSNGYVDGSEPQFAEIRYQPIEQGRWLNWNDERERHNVCVIGSEFVRLLFPGRPAVGSTILINSVPFEVVGTLQKVGHGNNNGQNMRLIMPFTTMAIYFPMQGPATQRRLSTWRTRPSHESSTKKPRRRCAVLWQEITTLIPRRRTRLTIGTRSLPPKWSARFPMPWTRSWERLGW